MSRAAPDKAVAQTANSAPLNGPANGPANGQASNPTAGTVAAGAPMLARRADTAIVVRDIVTAANEIHGIVTTAGGSVLSESIQANDNTLTAATNASLTVAVPADRLDDTLTRLDKLGEVAARNTSSDDVKAQYVDVAARITSLQTSVDRMRALLAQASKVEDLILLEGELSRRQADLDALTAQMNSLKDQVAMSPITIRLTTNRVDLGSDGGGFLGGLKAGWTAFLSSIRFLLTAVGAVLPFLVFFGLVATPLLLWVRRRRGGAAPASTPAAAPAPAPVGDPQEGAGRQATGPDQA